MAIRQEAACLEKAQTLVDAGYVDDAVKALTGLFWKALTPDVTSCMRLLVRCCLEMDEAKRAEQLMNTAKRFYARCVASTEATETLTRIIFDGMRAYLNNVEEKVKALQSKTPDDVRLFCLSGDISLDSYIQRYIVTPRDHLVRSLLYKIFLGCDFGSGNSTKVYSHFAIELVAICRQYQLVNVAERIAPSFSKKVSFFLSRDSSSQHGRTPELRRAVIEANCVHEYLCALLGLLTEFGAWDAAMQIMFTIRFYCRAIEERPNERRVLAEVFRCFADTLWRGGVVDYHAHCEVQHLLHCEDRKPEACARAVLAALCAPKRRAEDIIFSKSSMRDKLGSLFNDPDATREGLLALLLADAGLTAAVDPIVLQLAQQLEAPEGMDFAAAQASVTAILTKLPALAMYESELRQTILRCQLEVLSLSQNRIDISSLHFRSARGLTSDEYVNEIEPVILADADSVPVEIDAQSHTITLRNAVRVKTIAAVRAIAAGVTPAPAPPAPSTSAVTAAALLAATERTVALHELQGVSKSSVETRKSEKERELREAEAAREQARRAQEQRRVEEEGKKMIKKELRAYEEALQAERFRNVLARLRNMYKGFKADESSLVRKSPSDFETEVAAILTRIHTNEADASAEEITKANLLERARRQQERERLQSSPIVVDRRVIAENIRKRVDGDREDRETLGKFFGHAEQYAEACARRLETTTKTSRRDDEQRRLDEEMERLRAGMAQ